MVTIDVIALVLTGLGLTASILYYSMNLRNSNKTRELQLKAQEEATKTRQLQFLLEQNKEIIETSYTNIDLYWKTMNAQWTDFSDFIEKFGPDEDPDYFLYRNRIWRRFHVTGLMIRDGLLDIGAFMDYVGDTPILIWIKYKEIIEEFRFRFNLPNFLVGFEYLAEECDNYRIKQGWGAKTPDDMPWSNR